MIKLNKLTQAIATVTLVVGASSALAETVNVPATVTVNNAIDFAFTGELNFGELRATAATVAANCAALSLPANPASPLASSTATACTTAAGTIQSVGGTPSRPEFSIAGVAPFTTLSLTLPAGSVDLVANLPAGSAKFAVTEFSAYRTSGTPAAIVTGANNLATTSTGTATFTVGAKIITDPSGPTAGTYENGIPYQGTFDVTVAY